MKAVRLTAPKRPLENHEIPEPAPAADEVLIRVRAAGICHSDAHYRAGVSPTKTPLTLGHEVAGIVEKAGAGARKFQPGDRVCVHYLATCGSCEWCARGHEQFCNTGEMVGKHRDGGFAEKIVVPARSAFRLPDSVSFAHGAVMMCSSATAFHALRKARIRIGETVAIFGAGGLGMSAIQLARALGASRVLAVDIDPAKLELAETFGAEPVDAANADPVERILRATGGRGVDVSLELIGLPATMRQAVRALGRMGRAAIAGLSARPLEVDPYQELVNREAEIIGVSDHLASEIPELLRFAAGGRLDLGPVVSRSVPLDAAAINTVLDELERFGAPARTVVELPD